MKVSIDKFSKVPVYLQIADQIKSQIISGALPRGSALPSERALAQILDVHRNTVVKAYSELKSDAWIESRQGVGYIVAAANDENDAQDERGGEGAQPGRVNWVSEVAEKYLDMEKTFDDLFQRFTDESHYSLGSGVASREVYTSERVAGDIAALLTGSGPCQYFFSPYKGDKFLRQKLVAFLGTKGVKASSGEIQILSETNQALDFIVTLLVKPGDSVVMEEPVHPDMYRVMELAGAKILTVPVDGNGMNCEVLESLLTQTRPRLIFVNSSYHDPTGNILSIERRKKIVALSNRYRVPIIEEDAASELVYDGDKLPPIKAFDTAGNVIYIYSFSLTFIPGLSLAFVTGNRDLIRALSYLVSVRLMASDWMTQKLLGMYLDDGIYYTVAFKISRRLPHESRFGMPKARRACAARRELYKTERRRICLVQAAGRGGQQALYPQGLQHGCHADPRTRFLPLQERRARPYPHQLLLRAARAAGARHGGIAQSAGRRAGGMTGTRNGKSTDTSQAPFESVYFTA